jgi:hypothetical protein
MKMLTTRNAPKSVEVMSNTLFHQYGQSSRPMPLGAFPRRGFLLMKYRYAVVDVPFLNLLLL